MPILKKEPDAFPETIFELEAPWWVAHLRSRQEKVLARFLRERGIPFYLPQMEKRVQRSGRTFLSYLPLFSGYLFFRGGREEKLAAVKSNVIVSVLEPSDQAQISAELGQIHQLQLTEAPLVPHAYVAVRAVEVRQQRFSLIAEPFEVDCEHASLRFQNAADFAGALLPRFLGQVVEHDRTKHQVETRV